MQEDLRLLILIIGFVGVAFLIADSIRKRMKKRRTQKFDQRVFENTASQTNLNLGDDPLFDDDSTLEPFDIKDKGLYSGSNKTDSVKHKSKKQKTTKVSHTEPDVILFAIKPRVQDGFNGRTLEAALKSHDYRFGEKNIFHHHVDNDPEEAVLFSIAQSTEPGNFDLNTIKTQRVQGLVIFMQLPIAASDRTPLEIFENMLRSARQLAAALNGELCDNRHAQLSAKAISHVKQKIENSHQAELSSKVD